MGTRNTWTRTDSRLNIENNVKIASYCDIRVVANIAIYLNKIGIVPNSRSGVIREALKILENSILQQEKIIPVTSAEEAMYILDELGVDIRPSIINRPLQRMMENDSYLAETARTGIPTFSETPFIDENAGEIAGIPEGVEFAVSKEEEEK